MFMHKSDILNGKAQIWWAGRASFKSYRMIFLNVVAQVIERFQQSFYLAEKLNDTAQYSQK